LHRFEKLVVMQPARQDDLGQVPFHQWMINGQTLWASFHRVPDGYLLRFPNLADFTVSEDGNRVVATPVAGVSGQTIEHLYQFQVLPLALSRKFELVLHASAVEIGSFAVAFLGQSGLGKSSLAASFSTQGHRFLTDDGLHLNKTDEGQYWVNPGYPAIRLWQDSRAALIPQDARLSPPLDYTPKIRVLADDEMAFSDTPRPLRCIYLLGQGESRTVVIQPLAGNEIMVELVRNCFLLDIQEREMLTHHFGSLSELARKDMFFRLDYPREYAYLDRVRATVIEHSSSLSSQQG
jgi:hypothetical protein